ncbi:MAG: hypothetical protein ABI224_02640 [Acetobacteraceae bacterium]
MTSSPATPMPPASQHGTMPAPIPRQAIGVSASGLAATGALALGALALGAVALGTLAIGRLAIGELVLRSGHAKRLTIDDLTVVRLRVVEILAPESNVLRPVVRNPPQSFFRRRNRR